MQRLNNRHDIYDWDAKRYYCSNVQEKVSGYIEAKKLMEDQLLHNSPQNRIIQEVLGFYLSKKMDSKSCASSESWKKHSRNNYNLFITGT